MSPSAHHHLADEPVPNSTTQAHESSTSFASETRVEACSTTLRASASGGRRSAGDDGAHGCRGETRWAGHRAAPGPVPRGWGDRRSGGARRGRVRRDDAPDERPPRAPEIPPREVRGCADLQRRERERDEPDRLVVGGRRTRSSPSPRGRAASQATIHLRVPARSAAAPRRARAPARGAAQTRRSARREARRTRGC